MHRHARLALVVALCLGASPLAARLCEVACAARTEHCHEAKGSSPTGCPEKNHRTEAPSLAAGKSLSVAAGPSLAAEPILVAAGFPLHVGPDRRAPLCVGRALREPFTIAVLRL
jgi:hypothetical protein